MGSLGVGYGKGRGFILVSHVVFFSQEGFPYSAKCIVFFFHFPLIIACDKECQKNGGTYNL